MDQRPERGRLAEPDTAARMAKDTNYLLVALLEQHPLPLAT